MVCISIGCEFTTGAADATPPLRVEVLRRNTTLVVSSGMVVPSGKMLIYEAYSTLLRTSITLLGLTRPLVESRVSADGK